MKEEQALQVCLQSDKNQLLILALHGPFHGRNSNEVYS